MIPLINSIALQMITSCRSSTGRKSSWSAYSRTCHPSFHNSTCPSSCRSRGKSSSVRRQMPCLQTTQEQHQRLISPFSSHHLLFIIVKLRRKPNHFLVNEKLCCPCPCGPSNEIFAFQSPDMSTLILAR